MWTLLSIAWIVNAKILRNALISKERVTHPKVDDLEH